MFSLSEDRLKFVEKCEGDKANNNKFKWNDYLIKPLVDNLLLCMSQVIQHLEIESAQDVIDYFWPLGNKLPYFIEYENYFYQSICNNNNVNLLEIYPKYFTTDTNSKFAKLNEAVFIDFDFNSVHDLADLVADDLADLAAKMLNKINDESSSAQHIVKIPEYYLNKIKSNFASFESVHINNQKLLESYLLKYQIKIDPKTYQRLLCYFISNSSGTNYLDLLKSNACIPTKSKEFKLASGLLDPKENIFYEKLFDGSFFPTDIICDSKYLMLKLSTLGLMNMMTLSDPLIIGLAKSVSINSSDKLLSENLIHFLADLLMIRKEFSTELTNTLNEIPWMFAKQKPSDWSINWFVTERNEYKLFKPTELYSDKRELLIGR